jgi:hypothetical protein
MASDSRQELIVKRTIRDHSPSRTPSELRPYLDRANVLLLAEQILRAAQVMRKQIRGNRNSGGGYLVPGACCFIAKTIGSLHQVSDARHIRHLAGKKWASTQSLAISHLNLLFG